MVCRSCRICIFLRPCVISIFTLHVRENMEVCHKFSAMIINACIQNILCCILYPCTIRICLGFRILDCKPKIVIKVLVQFLGIIDFQTIILVLGTVYKQICHTVAGLRPCPFIFLHPYGKHRLLMYGYHQHIYNQIHRTSWTAVLNPGLALQNGSYRILHPEMAFQKIYQH